MAICDSNARTTGPKSGTADLHVGIAEVLLERNDLTGALEHLLASTTLGEQAHLPQQPYRWRVAMARTRLAEGNLSEAVELLDDAQRVFDSDFSPDVRPIAALRARVRLAQGVSGPDIAGELHVSVNTLRTHTKHIYTKLGANSRRAAIDRAEQLGL